ncbi:MAG: beta-ketoacyl-[acyl-carrier-protein] synthase family protein [Desulfobacterota bacterium]|nr:beta-ketoacyl-[acyl-carrier-protein] synthase family protein [Thermodesulfobacteriota bacterium]
MRRVVITGLGALTPIGNTLEELWCALVDCRSAIAPLCLPTAPLLPAGRAGQIHSFTPAVFNIPQKSLKVMNKTIQYALAASTRAVADAALAGSGYLPHEIGLYLGVNGIQYTAEELFLASYEAGGKDMRRYMDPEHQTVGEPIVFRDPDAAVHPLWPLSVLANMALCHIAIHHNIQGRNLAFSSIDASGMLAIGEAFAAIRRGELDIILAGGSYGLNTLDLLSLDRCGVLAHGDAVSIPFDRRRSGCVAGEGAALMVLEERERARKRGARIYAEVAGYCSWCDATVEPFAKSVVPESHLPLCRCIKGALQDAGCEPDAISLVYADGKGTVHNDRQETRAYEEIFNARCTTLPFATATPLTGYMFSAHGAFSALAAVLCIIHSMVPPLDNGVVLDEGCSLLFPKNTLKKQVTYVMANTFGFSGEHATLILQRHE